jgi:hypothetical protein
MLAYSTIDFKENIYSNFLEESICNLLDKTFVIPQSYVYNVFNVTKEYIARPDLISLDAYGDTMFADVICKLNGISNPFELNEGMKLIIPSPESIMDFVIRPNKNESEYIDSIYNSTSTNKSTSANKNKKRQANEAIVGDTRFKIDSVNGIIIY